MEEDDYDEEDEEGFGEEDDKKYDRDDGISMNIADLEKLYEFKNGKLTKKAGVVNEFENKAVSKNKKEDKTSTKTDKKIKEKLLSKNAD